MISKKGPGGSHPTEASRISAPQHRAQGKHDTADLPVVFATLLLAMPGLAHDRAIVKRCCFCHFSHVAHVPVGTGRTEPIIRPPRCAPWRRYSIEVVDVVPAAAVPGQRRRSAA